MEAVEQPQWCCRWSRYPFTGGRLPLEAVGRETTASGGGWAAPVELLVTVATHWQHHLWAVTVVLIRV